MNNAGKSTKRIDLIGIKWIEPWNIEKFRRVGDYSFDHYYTNGIHLYIWKYLIESGVRSIPWNEMEFILMEWIQH